MSQPEILSLFAGIGGLELGLEAATGARTTAQVELEPFCRAVLAKHWPEAERSITDVRNVAVGSFPPPAIICGGFPCQGLSAAGSRRRLEDPRSALAFEYLRVIEALAPASVVMENSYHGWKHWVPVVRSELWARGYASLPLRVRAADVGAPHRRARCFVIAYPHRPTLQQLRQWVALVEASRARAVAVDAGPEGVAPDAARARLAEREGQRRDPRQELSPPVGGGWGPPPPPVRRVDDGPRPGLDRPRLIALGNAVVPQAAWVVGRCLVDTLTAELAARGGA